MPRERIDRLLVTRGLAESREKAQRLIRAGKVRVNGTPSTKPGKEVDIESEIAVASPPRFVGRGGEKLLAALEHWTPDLTGVIALDIGASTGGFTDCMLQHGAARVYAIDVGRGQLAWSLRQDERVVVMEQTNARHLQPAALRGLPAEGAGFFSADVSFISLTKILPAVARLVAPDFRGVTLIKPQFEAGREHVEKGGVVRDPAVHEDVIERITRFGETELGWTCGGVIPSPLKGPAGNIEFLALWKGKPDG